LTAAEPTLRNINIRGLQIGGSTVITIDGDDLSTTPKLLLPFAAKQVLQPKSTEKSATFAVALDDTISPGLYNLRVVTANGVSLPMVIAVDRLAQVPFAEKITNLPAALHGTLAGSATLQTSFVGKAKQVVRIEVEAQRVGSKLRPIVHINDAKRKQLDWAWGNPSLGGDCRLEATLPDDGTYTVNIHDAEYNAASPGHFRLKIGDFNTVDRVFPPVVGAVFKSVELIGTRGSSMLDLAPPGPGGIVRLPLPKDGIWTGLQPFVTASNRKELIYSPNKDTKPVELDAGILAISGRLTSKDEEHVYRLPTTPGTKVRLELLAERLGSPLDLSLTIRSEAGAQLARAEDGPGTLDPVLEYTVPDKVTAVLVAILDSQGRCGPSCIYRMTVDPGTTAELPQSLRLSTISGRLTIPIGGKVLVPVLAERTAIPGQIVIAADGLPIGVKLSNAIIPDGADGTLVEVNASTGTFEAAITTWRGVIGFNRPIVQRGHAMEKLQPWLAEELSIASVPSSPPFSLDWTLPPDAAIVPTVKFTIPVKVTRPDPNAPVRLTLLTSQFVPLANNLPDSTKAIRIEKPVEIAAKATAGDVVLLVPPDLPSTSYDLAIQGELLTADKKTVLATAYTPIRRLPVRLPITLTGSPKAVAKLDAKVGFVAELTGTITREPTIIGEVTLAVTGLPAGARFEAKPVKADAKDFSAKLIFPANQPPGDLTGMKLGGSIAPDTKTPAVRVKSREVAFVVTIPPPEKK